MPPVREVTSVCLLKPLSSSDLDQYNSSIKACTSQPGLQALYAATSADDPTLLLWIIDWDDIASHQAFMAKTEEYKKMVDPLLTLCDTAKEGFIHVRHLPLSSPSVNLSVSPLSVDTSYSIGWISVEGEYTEGRLLDTIEIIRGDSQFEGLAGGIPIEEAREAILFSPKVSGPGNPLSTKASEVAQLSHAGVFNFTYYGRQ